jgi:hypothetical protein
MPLRVRALVLAVLAAAAIAYYERRPDALPAAAEALPPPPEVLEEPTWTPDLRPPEPVEVITAIERAFGGALPPEALPVHRAIAGDFNGDRSPDLAVPARVLAEKLPEINADFANWILQDPDAPLPPPGPHPRITPVHIEKGEILLAVVHGLEGAGWRNPRARQCYLLRLGEEGPLDVQKRERLLAKAARSKVALPQLTGDLIYEVETATYLYWDGARYARHASTAVRPP